MRQALRCSAGIADVKDLPRVTTADQAEILAALTRTPALALNPFGELGAGFASEDWEETSSELTREPRITKDHLAAALDESSGGKPPTSRVFDEPPRDDSGGAAFIQIHISNERTTEGAKRGRKLEI
jgi:hypothetical protein